MEKSAETNNAKSSNLPLFAVALCLVTGLIVDNKPWISTTSALLVPVLFIWLIYAYTKKDSDSIRFSIIWGLLGVCMLIFGVYADPKEINIHVVSVIISLSGTLISLAIIGVILQLKDTKEYFASSLSELIMKESYVEKLNRTQLEKLQKTVLERYFENSSDFNRENSFYRFFSKNLQNYIGSPYRENYRNTLSIAEVESLGPDHGNGKICLVSDDLTYQLRSMGADIQPTIKWLAVRDEIQELQSFSVWIGATLLFSWPAANDQDSESEFIEHNFAEDPVNGIELVIHLDRLAQSNQNIKKDYVDGAIVKISAKYLATNFKSITAKLLFPTKGFSLSVFHPSELRCKVESFGFNPGTQACEHNNTSQGFTFNYSDWMLPYSGVYVAVEDIDLVGKKTSPNTTNTARTNESSSTIPNSSILAEEGA